MTSREVLLAAVETVFVETSAGLAPWPDPRSGRAPSDEEYSRVTDPERYRLVPARAQAWIRALVETGVAVASEVEEIVWDVEPEGFPPVSARTRLDAVRPATIPLFMLVTGFAGLDDNGVEIAFGDPSIRWGGIIDCGCDACDRGSDDLLALVDEAFVDVVTGALLHRHDGRRSLQFGVERSSTRGEILSRRARRKANAAGSGARRAALLDATDGWSEIRGSSWLD